MKAKEVFALIVRLIGLLGLVYVVNNLATQLPKTDEPHYVFYFVKKAVYLLIGLYLLWGAPLLVSFAYSRDSNAPPEKQA